MKTTLEQLDTEWTTAAKIAAQKMAVASDKQKQDGLEAAAEAWADAWSAYAKAAKASDAWAAELTGKI